MTVKSKSMKKRILALVTVLAMMLSVTMSFLPVFAAEIPTLVEGRVLTPEETGDIVNWVEIAQYNGSSLIVRTNFINMIGGQYYGLPQYQYVAYGTSNAYYNSVVRDKINHWFSGVANYANWEDVLSPDARLREYSQQHNALSVLGTRYTPTTEFDGISLPSKYQVGIGNDIAFALSISEVANYVSTVRNWRGIDIPYCYSPAAAVANYEKLYIPDFRKVSLVPRYGMWLRTPGAVKESAGALLEEGYAHELSVPYQTANNLGYGLVYPALWVDSGIFKPDVIDIEVTYYPNGGIGEVKSYPATLDSNYIIMDQGYTKNNYAFAGWNTEADGSGTTYQNFSVIKITGNVNLYAQWKSASSIVYHANTNIPGEEEEVYVDYGDNGTFTIKSIMFDWPGNTFSEWNTARAGLGATLPPTLTFSNFYGTLHLYARWYGDT